ncbi:MAG: phosphoadenylyl-sulfate reductase [Actinomycetota bacterium]
MTAPPNLETGHRLTDARAALRWADETHGAGLCVTASFGDATLAHLAATTIPGVEITLLDTGYLFAETEWFATVLHERFDLRLRVIRPHADLDRDVWQRDTDACCAQRKTEPLERALRSRTGWVTGLRRSDSPGRAATPLIHHDLLRGVDKINPLAAWDDGDVERYAATHDLPEHPLADRGYASIGCWPCTQPVVDDGDPRAGRWPGTEKTECGLHVR